MPVLVAPHPIVDANHNAVARGTGSNRVRLPNNIATAFINFAGARRWMVLKRSGFLLLDPVSLPPPPA